MLTKKLAVVITLTLMVLLCPIAYARAQEGADTSTVDPPKPEETAAAPATAPTVAPTPTSTSDGWRVTWAPAYLWFSGFSGTVGARGQTTPVNAGFWDLASHLNFAYATNLDVGKGRFGFIVDLQYMHLGDDTTFSGPPPPLFSSADVDSKLFILEPDFYARAVDSDRGWFDVLAGFRYWHLDNDINFEPGLLPATEVKAGDNWVDPIVGFRFRVNLDQDKKWFLPARADIGGFNTGSDLTWQLFGGIGRSFTLAGHPSAAIFGYRKMFVDRDRESNGSLLKVSLSGPIFGMTISFGKQ